MPVSRRGWKSIENLRSGFCLIVFGCPASNESYVFLHRDIRKSRKTWFALYFWKISLGVLLALVKIDVRQRQFQIRRIGSPRKGYAEKWNAWNLIRTTCCPKGWWTEQTSFTAVCTVGAGGFTCIHIYIYTYIHIYTTSSFEGSLLYASNLSIVGELAWPLRKGDTYKWSIIKKLLFLWCHVPSQARKGG